MSQKITPDDLRAAAGRMLPPPSAPMSPLQRKLYWAADEIDRLRSMIEYAIKQLAHAENSGGMSAQEARMVHDSLVKQIGSENQ